MAALTQARMGISFTMKNVSLPLAAGEVVFQGGMACVDTSDNVVKEGVAGNANLIRIGEFLENVDNAASTVTADVMVSLDYELRGRWLDSDTGANAVTSANLFEEVYILDDHTVTTSASGNSKAGRVWAVDAVKGVAVAESKNL